MFIHSSTGLCFVPLQHFLTPKIFVRRHFTLQSVWWYFVCNPIPINLLIINQILKCMYTGLFCFANQCMLLLFTSLLLAPPPPLPSRNTSTNKNTDDACDETFRYRTSSAPGARDNNTRRGGVPLHGLGRNN